MSNDFNEVLAQECAVADGSNKLLKVDSVLSSLPREQAEKVVKALHNSQVTSAAIARALERVSGMYVSDKAVRTWRAKHCHAQGEQAL